MINRNIRLGILVTIISIIGVLMGIILYNGFYIISVEEIDMDLTVGKKVGFNADRDALHFGTTFAGGSSYRNILVSNNNSFPVIVRIINTGALSEWVTNEQNIYDVGANENISITYSATPPLTSKLGKYTGISKIIVKRRFI